MALWPLNLRAFSLTLVNKIYTLLFYKVYNGLFQRSDKETAMETPIGIIPGGSGNGLASSIAHLIK